MRPGIDTSTVTSWNSFLEVRCSSERGSRIGARRTHRFEIEFPQTIRQCDPITSLLPDCSINRYYDPATDQFLSVDPDVAQTDQSYVFTNDDPLNAEDPLGLVELYNAPEGEDVGPSNYGTGPEGTGTFDGGEGDVAGDAARNGVSEVSSEETVKKTLSNLEKGRNYPTVQSEEDLKTLFDNSIKGGKLIPNSGGFLQYELEDGTTVQWRPESGSGGATVDFIFPGSSRIIKVHIV